MQASLDKAKAELKEAEAKLEKAEAKLEKAKAELEKAKAELEEIALGFAPPRRSWRRPCQKMKRLFALGFAPLKLE
eukprot:g50225.t1